MVVNEAMAKRYWKGEDPVGQVVTIGKGLGPEFDDPPRQIVGIAGTVRENGLTRADVDVMYIPQSQVPEGLTTLVNSVAPLSWAVRTAAGPMTMRIPVERELRAVDEELPISRERTMEQAIRAHGRAPKFQHAVVEYLRRSRTGAGGHRDLRPYVLFS